MAKTPEGFLRAGLRAQAAVDKLGAGRPVAAKPEHEAPYGTPGSSAEHPNVVDAKQRARETGKYTRTSGYSVTIWAGGEMHHVYAPDGSDVCTVSAAAYADHKVKPRLVDEMADRLLAHLNREGLWIEMFRNEDNTFSHYSVMTIETGVVDVATAVMHATYEQAKAELDELRGAK